MAEHSELALDAAAQELLFAAARTAHAFSDEPVTEAQLRAIHELIKWGPTSSNMQPLRVLLVRSRAARERLLVHMKRGNRDKTAAAPLTAVAAADTRFHEQLGRLRPDKQDPGRSWERDAAFRERQARLNATLQIAYFIVGIRAAGLAAGPMAGFDPDGVDAEFFPDGRWRSLVVINIGRPAADAYRPRLPRLDYEDVFREI